MTVTRTIMMRIKNEDEGATAGRLRMLDSRRR